MAIKASATITLFDVVDIESTTWYYLLQSSTASAPAKPTTETPSSNWKTTEPTYTEGSTNTLYTVMKTTYSDGTFDYTPVSKSSSYEAAKAAYNKAVVANDTANNAKDAIDNLDIGGTNLCLGTKLFNSSFEKSNQLCKPYADHYSNYNFVILEDEFKAWQYKNTNNHKGISFNHFENLNNITINDEYVLQAMFKNFGYTKGTLEFYAMLFDNSGTRVEGKYIEFETMTGYKSTGSNVGILNFTEDVEKKIWIKIKPTQLLIDLFNDGGYGHLTFQLTSLTKTDNNSYINLWKMKLEKGNKPTDWTPAPEDVNNAIEETNNNLTDLRKDVYDSITNIISDNEKIILEALAQYVSADDFNTYKGIISTKLEQTAEDFTFLFNNAIEQINNLSESTSTRFIEIQKYIRFVDGNIILGETGNEITLTIENDRISFKQNDKEVAYLSNNKLYVTDAEFLNSLILGNFKYSIKKNGSLSFGKIQK